MGGRTKPEEELSRKPAQIKVRLRRNMRKRLEPLDRDIKMYTEVVWKKPIEEWDFEELSRGRPRNKDGSFRGVTPKWITPAVQQEAKRRLMARTYGELSAHIGAAIQTIYDLMTSEEIDHNGRPIVDARTKLACATFIIEHTIGKPKAIVEVKENITQQTALAAAIVMDDGRPQDVIDGEVVDDEDEEEYEDDEE